MKTLLLTSAPEDSEEIEQAVKEMDVRLLHLPLEEYVLKNKGRSASHVFDHLDHFENIIYRFKRSAVFFLREAEKRNKISEVKNRLNLVMDRPTSQILQEKGIPAVNPEVDKPLDLVEFMLKLRRLGPSLYPTGAHIREEIPGLLQELDIEVMELELFDLKGPGKSELKNYREKVEADEPGIIVFHSRRSVSRTLAAFPDIEYENKHLVAGDKAVSNKLKEHNFAAGSVAEGSWGSIIQEIEKLI